MGGSGAPGTLSEGVQTQLWLLTSDDPDAQRSGQLFHDRRPTQASPLAEDRGLQDQLMAVCAQVSGVSRPESGPSR
jgi:hypothetical protein